MSFPKVIAVVACLVIPSASAHAGHPALDLLPEAYRSKVADQLAKAGDNASNLANAIVQAPPEQREAVGFLVANMPEGDLKTLGSEYLLSNVRHAYLAREATSWGRKIPDELFFEDVLPYVSINERRDDWRKDFYDRFLPIARQSATPSEAVKRLNVEVFKTFNVAYHATKRPKPDQSPYESVKAGYASCTGLSILLIDACRAVGIPARMVGTPRWTDNSGNHTWVEVWDREWSFVGACEPSQLNEGWFLDKAAKADETKPEYRIYAVSFKTTDTHFPMVWKRSAQDVPAEDVTRRYTRRRRVTFQAPGASGEITIRQNGNLVAQDRIADATTFHLPGDLPYEVQIKKADGAKIVRTITLSSEPDQMIEVK